MTTPIFLSSVLVYSFSYTQNTNIKKMKIAFIFAGQVLLLCLSRYAADAVVIPRSINSKLFLTGETNSYYIDRVYHNETDKSYTVHERGPCGKLMWIQRKSPDSNIGVCRCIKTPLGLRSLVYWPSENRCYFANDQGPCKVKEWLQFNKEEQEWECKTNPCPISKLEREVGIDMESLVELESDYYFVDSDDNTTCLRNQIDLNNWHFNLNGVGVSRFLYHKKSQKFFPKGEKGDCPTLMELIPGPWPAEKFGSCGCRTLDDNQRPIVYWKQTDRCYFAYTQGPCASDEWLVGNGKSNVACRKIKCKATPAVNKENELESAVLKPDIQFFVSDENGTCYETNTQAFCAKQEKMFLGADGVSPYCVRLDENGNPMFISNYSIGDTSQHDCVEGFTWDKGGNCVREPNYS